MSLFRRKRESSSEMPTSDADGVWNRAAMGGGGSELRAGDTALADLLRFHSLAMNGGVLHAFESLSAEQRSAALQGYRFFGLRAAADAVEWLEQQADGVDLDGDVKTAERLDEEAQGRYDSAVAADAVLVTAFEQVYKQRPESFADIA